MPRTPALLRTLPFVAVIALAACQPAPDKNDNAPTGIAAKAMDEARKGLGEASQELQKAQSEIDAARQKLATENLTLNRNENQNLPKAEITPAGDLLIEGKSVATTPEQKEKVLAYRGAMITVVGDGMAIGMEGAKVGIDAAASALKGVLAGQSGDEIGKQVGAEAKTKMKPMVDQLCGRLPALLTAQQALAASVPEFKPYASMDQADVDDCASQSDWNF
jgi:hypothetical protein